MLSKATAIRGRAANLFVASPKLGIKTIPELIAKSRRTKLSYGTPGVGSQLHLAMELFKQKTGCEITHVPCGEDRGARRVRGSHPPRNRDLAGPDPAAQHHGELD